MRDMEDVSPLTKEEFLRFLNCTQHSSKPEICQVRGPKNTQISVVKKPGTYKVLNLKLDECSLNKQILRIPLPKLDFEELSVNEINRQFKKSQKAERRRKRPTANVSRFGRQLKKTKQNITSLPGQRRRTFRKCPIPIQLKKSFNSVVIKPNKTLTKNMSTYTGYRHDPKPNKPQFIIKYVPIEPTYYLKMAPLKHPEDGKLTYPFDNLVKDIKNMKLPSPTWKIKVVVKSNKIASIIFTNKCVLERTVSFNAKSDYFDIVIENRPAILLGAPTAVTCVEDIEILLNIIHTISAKNSMVYYKD